MTKGQKFSALGLVLMGASAVVAFALPNTNKKVFANGHLQLDSTTGAVDNQATCRTGVVVGLTKCDYTATDDNLSFTTGGPGTSADAATTGATNTGLLNDGNNTLVSTVS